MGQNAAASPATRPDRETVKRALAALGDGSIVLVGLMGAGKTTVGRRLASALSIPFRDADQEIEKAAGMTISDIFEVHGEAHFRDGERRVIQRLLTGGPQVLATGGGAFMDAETRSAIRDAGISIWLRGDLDLLMKRVSRRPTRPLLKKNARAVMRKLMEERYPVYQTADMTVDSRDLPHEVMVREIVVRLAEGAGAT